MQPQSAKNIYNGPSNPVNMPPQARTNHFSGGTANRQQNFVNSAPTNCYAIFPSIHPGMVMNQFNTAVYNARPPNLQQCQYAAPFYPQVCYPYYYYVPQLPQQQQQIGTIMGAMPMQPSCFANGPLATSANHSAVPFAVNVANSLPHMNFAAAVLAGNNRMALPPAMAAMPPTQVKGKLRSHALQIIHPVTNKNILQDLNNDKEISFPPTATTSQTQIFHKQTIKISKSAEILLNKDYTKNLDCVQMDSVVAIKINNKDDTQQTEQITIATTRTQDACVEIVPNSEELLKTALDEAPKETAVKPQHLQKNFSGESLKLSESFNQIKTLKEENCVTKNSGEIVREASISEVVNLEKSRVGIEKSPKGENDQTDIASNKNSKTSVEKESVDKANDDAKSSTDTSSVFEETFLPAQKVSENANTCTCTESDETEAEIFKEESLIIYNELGEISSSPTDRKQYTRKQLMQLRLSKQSCIKPEIKNISIFAPVNLMPAFATRAHTNGSLLVTSAIGNVSSYINYQNNYTKQNARAKRGSNNGAGSAVAGTSLGHHHHHNRNKGKPMIYINLNLNRDVELNKADQAWKPRALAAATATALDDANANMPPEKEELLRRVRGILNKLTPEKFEPLVEQIIMLKIDTMDKMEAIMNLVFEKAVDEPNFSLIYAKLCHRLISEVKASDEPMEIYTKTNLAYFRNALLDKAEQEFTHHVTNINAKEEKLKPLKENYDNCVDSNEKIELEALLSEEERKIRRRSCGTVRFIGELFKMSILSGKKIQSFIEALLKDPYNEDMLECLCKLVTTVGQTFEQTCMSQNNKRKFSLKSVIQRMHKIASRTGNTKISSRVRFMLQDVIDLRKKKWQSTRNEAPTTMEQIEKEICNTNQTVTESLTNSLKESKKIQISEQSSTEKRIERFNGGYNEGNHSLKDLKRSELSATHNATKWQVNAGKQNSSQTVDTTKLSSQPTISGTNHGGERNLSGSQSKNLYKKPAQERENGPIKEVVKNNPMTKTNNKNKYREEMEASTSSDCSSSTPKAVFKEPNNSELKLIKSVVNELLENATTSKFIDNDTVSCIQRLPATLRCPLIYYILTDYLHLVNVKPLSRRQLSHLIAYMIEHQYLTLEHFHLAYRNFASIASDLIVDIPELWLYIFEFTGPLIVKNLITVHDLWNSQLKKSGSSSFSKQFLKSLLTYSTREIGPCFTRNMWQKYRMKWSDFMAKTEVDNFITSHQFEFVEDFTKPVNIMVNSKESLETLQKRVMQHIQQLLKENCHPDLIIDYINGNISQMNRNFINNLSRILNNFALKDDEIYSLNISEYQNICLPILRRYLDSMFEDQETFLPAQKVSANGNTCTESDETDSESFKKESLINYNEPKEIPSSPRDRKQYTRNQLMQLRHSKQSCMQPEVKNSSIFAPINLMPAFATRAHTNGSLLITSARGNVSSYINYQNNYTKQNARANRGSNNGAGSAVAGTSLGHHHQHNRNKGKPMIYINLNLNRDVELNKADQAWKPRALAAATALDDANANMPPEKEELLRRVRGILNKLTPEKFEPLVEQIIMLKIDTMDKMEAIMNLVFEKAVDEPNFSLIYAKLCHRLISEVKASDEPMEIYTKTNLAYFRNALLDKAEQEFTHHVTNINAKEEKLKPLKENYDNCVDSNEKIELEALLSEEERKIRRRSCGTVRFIGELFKMSILSGKKIQSFIEALLKDPYNEDMLECLCKLVTTVGQTFEQTCMSQNNKRKFSLKSVIQRMHKIASRTGNTKISSRVRFMLQDVIDLRKKKWQSTRNEAPTTMEQIEKEICNTNQTVTESLTNSLKESKKIQISEQSSTEKRIERFNGGYNEGNHSLKDLKRSELSATHNATKWQVNAGKQNSSQTVDTTKLSSQPTISGTNHGGERNLSGSQSKNLYKKPAQERENGPIKEVVKNNPMTKTNNKNKYREEMEASTSSDCSSSTPKAVFKEPNNSELKLIKSVVNELLENATTSKFIDNDTVSCIQRLPATLRCPLIYYILTDYLHLVNVKPLSRRQLSHLIAYMIEHQYLTLEHFHLAYRNFASIASDLIVDIPELWLYIFEFTGPLIVKNLITVHDLWNSQLKKSGSSSFSKQFLKSLLTYSTREIGPCFTRNMWQKYRMKWSDFMAKTEVDNFITSHQFEFVEDFTKPVNIMVNSKESLETLQKRVMQHIQQLLKENCHPDLIIDYINGNISQMNRNFINNLSRILNNFALKDDEIYSLNISEYQNICLPILRRYLDSMFEDQETFLPAQKVSANGNTCTESDETDSESFKKESLINYNEPKEIPSSPRDRKQYTRKQLMQLRHSKQSCMQPEVKNSSIFAPINLMPAFATRAHTNGSLLITSARGNVSSYINYQNNYTKQNARANRGSNNGAGSAVAGTSLGHHHQHNRNKGKPMIYINLNLNRDVELNKADQAWKPRGLTTPTASDDANANMPAEKEELLRRVRGILNKLTPKKFEPLVEQIIMLKIDTMDKMEAIMNLVFEKAVDEPNFSLTYAKLCHRLISEVKASDERMESSTKTNLAYFRNALLAKAEQEFTHHVTNINAKEDKLKPLKEKYDKCVDSNEKIELEALLSEEESKIRRRSGGTVRFIGELFKMSILSGKIIHSFIEALLKDPYNEDMLECLCKLVTTVGQTFEQTCMSQNNKRKFSLKSVIQRMQNIASRTGNTKISSRVRFMLQDVIDLRKKKWQSTRNEAPKTMEQIEKEINNNNQTLTNSYQKGKRIQKSEQTSGGKRIERSHGGYNEGNHTLKHSELSSAHNANKWQVNTGKQNSSQAVDTTKLVGLTNVDMNNKKMGAASLFQWRRMSSQPATSGANSLAALSNMEANKTLKFQQPGRERNLSGSQSKNLHNKAAQERENCAGKEVVKSNPNTRNPQRTDRMPMPKTNNQNKYGEGIQSSTSTNCRSSTPKAVFKEPNNNELKLIKSVVNEMLENANTSKFIESDTVSCIQRLPATLRFPLIYYILTDYLHLANVNPLSRRQLSHLIAYMIEHQYLTLEHFHLAYRNFASIASDLIVDIPELWLYIFEFTGPLIVKNLITVHDLWNSQLKKSDSASFSKKFLKSLLTYSTREIGPCFTRNMWQKHHLKWSDFMAKTEVDNFITSHQFEFVEDFTKPVNIMVNSKESLETLQKRVMQHIEQLLKENCHPDLIIDYINGNITQMNRDFINNLSRILTNFALKYDEIFSLDIWKFQNICLPILRRYLNSQEDLELECLNAIHLLIQNLENPKGLWQTICAELNEAEIIAQETFTAWQQSMAERH